jgi:hypothetical protein
MSSDESLDTLTYADQMHLAERELATFYLGAKLCRFFPWRVAGTPRWLMRLRPRWLLTP